LTKDQFVLRIAAFERRDKRAGAIYLTVLFALLIGNIALAPYVPNTYKSVYFDVVFTLMVGNVVAMLYYSRDQTKRNGLVCRSCEGGLLGVPGQLAIATGTCPHCGRPAFDDSMKLE
jgi:hypothetical protein